MLKQVRLPLEPGFAEPWLMTFNAQLESRIAMTPDDLGRAKALGKEWA
jgi:hypothetical protein